MGRDRLPSHMPGRNRGLPCLAQHQPVSSIRSPHFAEEETEAQVRDIAKWNLKPGLSRSNILPTWSPGAVVEVAKEGVDLWPPSV